MVEKREEWECLEFVGTREILGFRAFQERLAFQASKGMVVFRVFLEEKADLAQPGPLEPLDFQDRKETMDYRDCLVQVD